MNALFSRKLLFFTLLTAAAAQIPSDADIRKILVQRIDEYKQGVGIVAGVIDAQGRRVVAYGVMDKTDPRPVNGETIFEIGSVTKAFTGLLLADMVEHGEVSLGDPIGRYLPTMVKVPERAGKQITIEDLATHTSGLPRLPSNLKLTNPANPYAAYTVAQLYEFLSHYTLTRDIGFKFEYSNLGMGLLGHVLALRAGKSYEELVRERILKPLGMNSTGIVLTAEEKKRLATGHDDKLAAVSNWDLTALAGAGALRSTADDLLKLLAATLGYEKSRLAPAMAAAIKVRRLTGSPTFEQALGWQISPGPQGEIVWKDGATGGYSAFIGYNPSSRTGVVVLANTLGMSGAIIGIDDIGLHLMNPKFPLNEAPKEHKQITLDPKALDRYTGRYQMRPNFILTIHREGDHLYAQATGQGAFEIFPESGTEFFAKIGGISITFPQGEGPASELVLHQGGANVRSPRLEGEATAPGEKTHKEAAVDPKLFDGYVGKYELAPQFVIAVTREGNQLFVQATGQPKFQVFPERPKDFFFKVVDAQITFETEANGKATALILHQNGLDQRAKRVE